MYSCAPHPSSQALPVARVFCERSGTWAGELHELGYEVWQYDLSLPPGVNRLYENWYQVGGDCTPHLNHPADIVCAFPPCTDLANSGARHWPKKNVLPAISFLTRCALAAATARVAGLVENPVGLASRVLGRYSLLCDPWEWAHSGREWCNKRTALWLYGAWPVPFRKWTGGLSKPREFVTRIGPSQDRAALRSVAWRGMAEAFCGALPGVEGVPA